ncbi:MAG TPA: replication-associated recombination protein A [Pirellulaceae bacterium]|nr:replication-associated recombination protein A [Pirellulaceae bacterium]HMO92260.1 replication-associated recombination protein A [Pirellulaceae bacterium]HMP70076.1 replication-associated recombination protein A [Pirellulaceae bacterium]
MSLFKQAEQEHLEAAQPLATRMRPTSLADFVGQQHLIGDGALLRRMIAADRLGSVIFFGPPGTGKTTLARAIATETSRKFVQLSAISSGVKELREILQTARQRIENSGEGTILFIDEIHRFNRTQQDALLGDVEDGIVSLIGATTANPFFAVNDALISRSQIFQFEPLQDAEVVHLLRRALIAPRGLAQFAVQVEAGSLEQLAKLSGGDARQALNLLEVTVRSDGPPPIRLTPEKIAQSLIRCAARYDVDGDDHYDCVSALIKSLRGSDPDASIYWLARMLEGGEDVRFLCRRLVILASEDIGNADPQALVLATSCFNACEQVGLPEAQLILAQTVTYLACAPKSNAATKAISAARNDIRSGMIVPVPRALRDAHYRGASELGHGEGYVYAHDADEGVVRQDYLGVEKIYYEPVERGFEQELRERLARIRSLLR